MALPSSSATPQARQPDGLLQVAQQDRPHERDTTIPSVTNRPANAPDSDSGQSGAVTFFESMPVGRSATANVGGYRGASFSSAVPVRSARAEIDAISEGASFQLTSLDTAMSQMHCGEIPLHFTVPDPAARHLVKFGQMSVSLYNASPKQIKELLHLIITDCLKLPGGKDPNESWTYACVAHLLSLGVDINADGAGQIEMSSLLDVVVHMNAWPLVRLLLAHGVRLDGSFAMFCADKATNINIVRELLKAGADPWLSLGSPEQLPTNCSHVGIAEFYRQTGMDINARASSVNTSTDNLSALDMAYRSRDVERVSHLLDAGAYVTQTFGMDFKFSDHEYHVAWPISTPGVIDIYRAERKHAPHAVKPYALLLDALQLGPTSAFSTSITGTAGSTSSLAQASLKPACNALIDGRYSAAVVAGLIKNVANMPPAFAQAVVQALALARVLGEYNADQGSGDLDEEIHVALVDAGLWNKYLSSMAQFLMLQTDIDRYQASGFTLLTTAAWNGKIRMIRILVKLGAKVNYPDMHGSYPLIAAAKARKPDTFSALLSLGANPGTTDLQQRSALIHLADWLTRTDISDMASVGKIASLLEQVLRLGYDLRQPTPKNQADLNHAAYPTVADLLCKPENCVKLALLGRERTEKLVQAILANIDRRGSLPFLN